MAAQIACRLCFHSNMQPGRLERGFVDVWQINLAQSEQTVAALEPLLSAPERTRAASLLYPRDRDRYTVAHAALRVILAALLAREPESLILAAGPHGKPYVPDCALHFNLSHAGTRALVAVSPDRRVGVDLEPIRDLPDALALAEQFAPAERSALQAAYSPRAFFECWTRKEAFVKATGEGLSCPLESFAVSFHPDPVPSLTAHGQPIPGWQLLNLPLDSSPHDDFARQDYAAALVVEAFPQEPHPAVRLRIFHF